MAMIYGFKAASNWSKIVESIVDSHTRPPTRFDAAYKFAREGHVDPLRELTDACREARPCSRIYSGDDTYLARRAKQESGLHLI